MPNHNAATSDFAHALATTAAQVDALLESDPSDAYARRDEWADLDEPLPESGAGLDAALDELVRRVAPFGNRQTDPGFLGWITSGPTVAPVAAATVASVLAPQKYGLSAFNMLEEVSLDWLAELCSLGPHMKGVYSSGGSVANLLALGAARQHAFTEAGLDPAADGVDGRRVAIYTSTEAHHTIARSAAVLGLGRHSIRSVPIDRAQRMIPSELERMIDDDLGQGVLPIAVVAAAGTTNTGAIDPLDEVGTIAVDRGVWFHVDGAYGLVGSLDERIADRYKGLERADSAIVDPHKWLGAPVGIAATFVRDRAILFDTFTQEPADYLEGSFAGDGGPESTFDAMGVPYSEFGVELSSPSRGVQVWAILKELGREGVRHRIRTDNDFARLTTAIASEHQSLEPLTDPELSIATFRFVDGRIDDLDSFNHELLLRVRRTSRYTISSTVVNGSFAIRPCYINARTTREHVAELMDTVVATGTSMLTR
jgi:aromatic-L-amino-acid decarboxylase